MAIFNGLILAFTPVFSQSYYSSGLYNISDVRNNTDMTQYTKPGVDTAAIILNFATTNIVFLGVGTLLIFITKSLQYFAICAIAGFITSLWTTTSATMHGLLSTIQNPIVNAIYTMIALAIGLVAAVIIVGIFAQQDQE